MIDNTVIAAQNDLPRVDRLQQVVDKGLFFLVLFAGCLYMAVAKFFHWQQWVVTLVPVALIVVYGITLWRAKRYQMREDKAGDNLYYLGFLYTLVSLALTLIQYSLGTSTIDEIITNFGIALFTTIAGMGGRVIMNQMREDLFDLETDARIALSDATTQLRTELLQSVEDINAFRIATLQSMAEANQQVIEFTSKSLKATTDEYASVLTGAVKAFEGEVKKLNDYASKLTKNTDKIVDSSSKLWQRLEAIKAPSDILDKKFDVIVGRLGESVDNLTNSTRAMVDQRDALQGVIENSESAVSMIGDTVNAMLRHVNASSEAQSRMSGIGDVVEALRNHVTALSESVCGLVEENKQQAQSLRQAFVEDVEVIREYRQKAKEVSQDSILVLNAFNNTAKILSDVANRMGGALNGLDQHLLTMADNTRQTAQVCAEQRAMVQNHYQSIHDLSLALNEQAQVIHANLSQMSNVQQSFVVAGEEVGRLQDSLSTALHGLEGTMAGQQRVLTASRELIERDVSSTKSLRETLETDVQQIRSAAAEMNVTLVRLANGIVQSLNESRP